MTITVAGDYEFTNGTTTSGSISFEPQKAIGEGFCFNCDKPVAIEYDQWWIGGYVPPKICQECGGHDVEFMGRVAERLWERLGTKYSITLELDGDDINAIEDSFFCHFSEKQVKGIWNRLCRIWKDICSQVDAQEAHDLP